MEREEPTVELPKPGDVLVGKYRVEGVLREGGMGAILSAYHQALDQRVAVKVLRADAAKEEVSVQRFVFEAQVAAKLACEHVARVIDAGRLDSNLPFLAMEYLDGCDLGELLKLEGPLPVEDVVDYMLQALAGVATAHSQGIVHRDLKPSNLFLALRADGTHAIKILDFGISKSTNAEANPNYKSVTGQQMLGSPVYMSPEQIRNARAVDARSDIWSIGIVMYELTSGAIPFDGDGVGEILAAILDAKPQALADKKPGVPRGLSDAVAKCLQKDRDARFQTAAELAHAIAPFGSGKHKALVERIAKTLVHGRTPRNASTPKMRAVSVDTAYGGPDVPTVPPPPRAPPTTKAPGKPPPPPKAAGAKPPPPPPIAATATPPISAPIALARTTPSGITVKSDPPLDRAELERTHPSIRRRRNAGAAALVAMAAVAVCTAGIVISSRGAGTAHARFASAQVAPSIALRSPSMPNDANLEGASSAPAPMPAPSASSLAATDTPAPSATHAKSSARPPYGAPPRAATVSRPAILHSRD